MKNALILMLRHVIFFKSLGLKIVICKKYKECHKNIEDLYNFDGWEDDTDGE